MGGLEEWITLMLNLFPSCFTDKLQYNTHFDMCIVDGTQFSASVKYTKGSSSNNNNNNNNNNNDDTTGFNAKNLNFKMVKMVYDYMNNDNEPDRAIIDKVTVILLDT